ncbi:hypothetical protein BH10PSE7_BH10PSE7_14230 [soil metagenome]
MASKPVWTLDHIYDNFLREGTWDPDTNFLSFSFPQSKPGGYWHVGDDEDKSFTAFTDPQELWARRAIQLWEDVVSINFIDNEHSGSADIRFMNTYNGGAGTAHAYLPGSTYHTGDIWVHADKVDNFSFWYGLLAVKTLIHEIGHTLGLAHPGNYDASDSEDPTYAEDAKYLQDSHQYTVMSYFGPDNTGAVHWASPQTPMLHDIYVLQQRYGANLATRTGDTVYGFNSNAGNPVYDFNINVNPVLAIWDANGTDTLDLSGNDWNQDIDLSPGRFTSALGGKDNIAIAYSCWIENARAGGGDDRAFGNIYANSLRGNEGDDTLYGMQGDDYLAGNAGKDHLFGSTGNDEMLGGTNDDRLYGWTGDDTIDGGTGADYLEGWTGDDTLTGGDGNDTLSGYTGVDEFDGDAGLDVVSYEYSNVSWNVDLSPDNGLAPIAVANGSAEILFEVEGVAMGDGNDTVYGSDGDNRIYGNDGNDRLYSYLGDDTLNGGDGNDTIARDDGDKLIEGGAGIDLVDYGPTKHAIHIDLYNQFSSQRVVDQPGLSADQIDRVIGVENLKATSYDDTVSGSMTDNTIDGQNGHDALRGWNGDDSLFGGYGNDTLDGGGGNDTLAGGIGVDFVSYADRWAGIEVSTADGAHVVKNAGTDHLSGIEGLIGTDYGDELDGGDGYNILLGYLGNDTLDGHGASDSLNGGDGHDVLTGGAGDDTMHGGDGSDTVNYAGSAGFVRIDLDVFTAQEGGFTEGHDRIDGIENAVGSSVGDELRGTAGANKLYGLGGDDLLEGRGGNDILDGGMGSDTVSYESAYTRVMVNLANVLPQNTQGGGVDSFISIENVEGSYYDDILTGNAQGNYLLGENGNDWLLGGNGDDWLGGRNGDDLIFADFGDDILNGEDGSDTASFIFATAGVTVSIATNSQQDLGVMGTDRLYFFEHLAGSAFDDGLTGTLWGNRLEGFAGDDTITGAAGDDTILAGNGADLVKGGTGEDEMTGGDGADIFAFFALAESDPDSGSSDLITDFTQGTDRIDLTGIGVPLSFIGTSGFSAPGQIRYHPHAEDGWTTLAVNTIGNGNPEMRIRLDGVLDLTEADFVL